MELQSGSHISLMSCTIDVVKHGVTWMVIRIKLYGDEVMHSKTRRCNVISGRSLGGDARMHNLLLTGIYKGIFAQVLAQKSSFCAYVHF